MSLLHLLVVSAIATILLSLQADCTACSTKCKPGSSCWPDEAKWTELNKSVDGRLVLPVPWAWFCHDPHYDQQACDAARRDQTNPFRRSDVVGAMQYPNWEAGITSPGCPLNASRASPCYQGQVPAYAINASNISHIQSGVSFAKKHNLRLVIKSTGHDWLGRSTAAGSLCIWLHHLTKISLQQSFKPDGCSNEQGTSAVTAQSGATWDAVYDFLDPKNLVVVGPMGSSVSAAGGFVQGGGHSPLSRTFGLAADNVLQYKLVTADGQVRIANKCQNKDLFWALSGGGGGTYGVVVEATYRTFPAFAHGIVQILYVAASSNIASHRSLIRRFIEVTPSMDAAGLAGYFYFYPNYILLSFLLPNGTASAARAAFDPLVSYVEADPLLSTIIYNVTAYDTFVQWHNGVQCPNNPGVCTDQTGMPRRLATRFMPKRIIENSTDLLTNTFMKILFLRNFSPIFGLFVVGGAASNTQGKNNSVSAVWRESLWHVSLSRTWNDSTSLQEQQQIANYLTSTNQLLRRITPGGGCYVNEADYNEPDWQQSFFGENYAVLLSIKKSIDPSGLFLCWKCVGSESLCEEP